MVKSVYPANKEMHAYGGHFLVGEYSPARRSPSLPAIPARASAYPASIVKVRPRYPRWSAALEQEDITRIPTVPQSETIWQFETPHYAAESSLTSLTLAVTDTNLIARPAISRTATIQQRKGAQQTRKRDYSIVARLHEHHVADIDTVPPLLSSPLEQRRPKAPFLHPIESIRWWLIQPGRLEFLIWLFGTILLIGLTVLFILFVLSSLGYLAIH
ncbi:hypothetical protein [Dictyobacter formicarum]|nr:hypothetical protein [Dictyobacter formicarum]